jgi:hypothetical protein
MRIQEVRLKRAEIAASGVDLNTLGLPKRERQKIQMIRDKKMMEEKKAMIAGAEATAEEASASGLGMEMEM